MEIAVISDGACYNNIICGIGVYITDTKTKKVIAKHSENIGKGNVIDAEYRAFIEGLEMVLDITNERDIKKVYFFSDSLLLIQQISGEYKTRLKYMKDYIATIHTLLEKVNKKISNVVVDKIPREFTHKADELASEACRQGQVEQAKKDFPFLKEKN